MRDGRFRKITRNSSSPAIPPFDSTPIALLRLARLGGAHLHGAQCNPARRQRRRRETHAPIASSRSQPSERSARVSGCLTSPPPEGVRPRLRGRDSPAGGPPSARRRSAAPSPGTRCRSPLRSPEWGPAAAAAATGSGSVRPQREPDLPEPTRRPGSVAGPDCPPREGVPGRTGPGTGRPGIISGPAGLGAARWSCERARAHTHTACWDPLSGPARTTA